MKLSTSLRASGRRIYGESLDLLNSGIHPSDDRRWSGELIHSIHCIYRYVNSFERMLKRNALPSKQPILLKSISFHTIPKFVSLFDNWWAMCITQLHQVHDITRQARHMSSIWDLQCLQREATHLFFRTTRWRNQVPISVVELLVCYANTWLL